MRGAYAKEAESSTFGGTKVEGTFWSHLLRDKSGWHLSKVSVPNTRRPSNTSTSERPRSVSVSRGTSVARE